MAMAVGVIEVLCRRPNSVLYLIGNVAFVITIFQLRRQEEKRRNGQRNNNYVRAQLATADSDMLNSGRRISAVTFVKILVVLLLLLPISLCVLEATCILRGPANPSAYLTSERKNMLHVLAEREVRETHSADDGIRCLPDGTMASCSVDRENEVVLFRQRVFRAFADYYVYKDGNVICKSNFDLSFFLHGRIICMLVMVALVVLMFFKWTFLEGIANSFAGFLTMTVLGGIVVGAACVSILLIITDAVKLYRLEKGPGQFCSRYFVEQKFSSTCNANTKGAGHV